MLCYLFSPYPTSLRTQRCSAPFVLICRCIAVPHQLNIHAKMLYGQYQPLCTFALSASAKGDLLNNFIILEYSIKVML